MFGIAWGIVSIVVMVAAGEGLRAGQAKQSATFGKDVMIVFAGKTSLQAGGLRAGRRVRWEDTDIHQLEQDAPDCKYILPELGQGNIQVHSAFNAASITVTGSTPPFAEVRSVEVGEGRFYNDEDMLDTRRVAFLGSDAKKQLFPHSEGIGETVYLANIPYRVVGIMKSKEQDSSYDGMDVNKVFIPFAPMRLDFPNKPPDDSHTLDRLLVTPASLDQHERCKAEIIGGLARLHGFDPTDKEAASVWDTVEDVKAFKTMTDGMKYFLGAVGFTTLFLGGLGVMNVMLVAVRERTREIGVRKALGATSQTILRQFFVETLIVVFISGALGFTVAYGFCGLVDLMPMPPFFAGLLPSWRAGLLSFSLLGAIAIAAAMYPANRAASIDPIEALRHEAGG